MKMHSSPVKLQIPPPRRLPIRAGLLTLMAVVLILAPASLSAQTQWTKYEGNPILDVGSFGTWDDGAVIAPWVYFDGTVYRMWYTGNDENNFRIGHAESLDGITWTKDTQNPILDLGSGGSWDDFLVGFPSILYDGSTFHMWYTGSDGFFFSGPSAGRIGYATSPDGITWTRDTSNPVLDVGSLGDWDSDDVWRPFVFRDGTMYRMWYSGSDGNFIRTGHATSPDGIIWSKDSLNPVLDVGPSGSWDEVKAGSQSIVFDGNTYHMWYEGGSFLNWRVGYATSLDGVDWTKYGLNPVLSIGAAGSWDGISVQGCFIAFNDSASTYEMWYTGYDGEHERFGYATSLNGLRKVAVSPNTYVAPGSDSVVVTAFFTGDTTGLSLFAQFESPDSILAESLSLFDDGIHNDGAAGDSVFGNAWPLPAAVEQNYLVGLQAVLMDTVVIRYHDLARFTTIGPVGYEAYTLTGPDTIPHPGDRTYFFLSLRNDGVTATAVGISATMTTSDSCVTGIERSAAAFGDIGAGETTTGSGNNYYAIDINENCLGGIDVLLHLSIASDGVAFWSDSFSVHINPLSVAADEGLLPESFALHPAYPNPFNPVATIRYELPEVAQARLTVYDLRGRAVRTLIRGVQSPGSKTAVWDGRDAAGAGVSTGIYIARLVTAEFAESIKMVLLK